MKGHVIVGLDIGTSTVKVLVALKKPNEENLEVLSQISENAFGVRKGVVIDITNVSGVIQMAMNKAREESKQKADSVYVNMGGTHLFSTSSHGLVSVSRADRKISREDIDRVLQAAQTISLPSNKEILHAFPIEFTIDGEKGLKEVLGMEGVRLETDVIAVGVFSPYLRNLTQAVSSAGLGIDNVVPAPLASAAAVLKKKEKELGVVVLDIGAGTTEVAVYEEGNLIYTSILPIGSAHITNDLAVGLKIDVDLAERIKLEFGNCIFRGKDKKEKVELEEGEHLIFSHKQVAKITEARVSEIFGEVNKELKKISKKGQLPAGVVLTGGGARLPKIVELAKKDLKLPCRIGHSQGFSQEMDDPGLSTVCGLVLTGAAELGEETSTLREGFNLSVGKKVGSRLRKILKIFVP